MKPRRKGLKRSPLKRSNPERKARRFEAKYGSKERVKWFKAQPCETCPSLGPCDNSHMIHGGPPETILSQCSGPDGCHAKFHRGRHSFPASIGKTFDDLLEMAKRQDERFRRLHATSKGDAQ